MLKKVIIMLASKYLAIKAKMREIETRLIIHSLLLRDKKLLRHLFRQRKCLNLNLPNTVEDEDYQSENIAAFINNSDATTPVTVMQFAEEAENEMGKEEEDKHLDLRSSLCEDCQVKDHSKSVIEMVKNEKEGQGKEFRLEDDIDQVADLFIQRFHQQIRLQKFHSDPPLSCSSY